MAFLFLFTAIVAKVLQRACCKTIALDDGNLILRDRETPTPTSGEQGRAWSMALGAALSDSTLRLRL